MKIAVILAYTDCQRRGIPFRGALQPRIGEYIAGLLPPDLDIEVINDTWTDPDWRKNYDLVFISSLHSDSDRARECVLYLPGIVSFEAPIPGTPKFHRLAAESRPAFLPNAQLREFGGYTLVTRPKQSSTERKVGSCPKPSV